MKTILPSADYSQKMYTCPNPQCEWPHWFTVKQLEKNRLVITCNCGTTFRPRLSLDEEKLKRDKNKLLTNRKFLLALSVVKSRKSKERAIEAVTAVFSELKSLENLIEDAINYGS